MMILRFFILSLMMLCGSKIFAFETSATSNLMDDLLIVEHWNRVQNERFPVSYNHLFYGGYLNMPSARMSCEGILGAGFAYVPPYHQYNLYCQLTSFLEVSGNYRVFRGVDDPILTPLGFGDMSDKGANFKIALFRCEDSHYELPGIAVGFEDFMGTRNFKSKYIVLTKVFLKYDFEFSLGYGAERIRGLFGGMIWMPFRRSAYPWLQPITLVAEYDATPYHDEKVEKHPKGRTRKSRINAGVKYRLWNAIDLSLSYVRGEKMAFGCDIFYDFGHTQGFLPKIDDALPYNGPIIREPLGLLRSEYALVHDLVFAFNEQGIDVLNISLGYDQCRRKTLRMKIYNSTYRLEPLLRERLDCLLGSLISEDIEQVIVVIDAEGFPIQEYRYTMMYAHAYGDGMMGANELKTLTPLTEVDWEDPFCYTNLFEKNRESYNWVILPKTHTFFGSSRGKFKYSLGINAGINGFLPGEIYYSILFGYNAISNLYDLSDTDRLNPSQLINVRTDIVNYYKQKAITLDEAYLQKCWNMGRSFYSRLAIGYFEEEYAGVAGEILYYPLKYPFAIGVEGAIFKKRSYKGYGFTSKVRKLEGFVPHWKSFPYGSQYFLNLYYDWACVNIDFAIKIGKFLANDIGIRYEVSRYFPSGLRVTLWYTHTNGHDKINGHRYNDKGVSLSLPLDMFYTESDRKRWSYGMSAWLRDVGVIAETGQSLYELINDQRQK